MTRYEFEKLIEDKEKIHECFMCPNTTKIFICNPYHENDVAKVKVAFVCTECEYLFERF